MLQSSIISASIPLPTSNYTLLITLVSGETVIKFTRMSPREGLSLQTGINDISYICPVFAAEAIQNDIRVRINTREDCKMYI
jgi:hypothetical protein